MSNLLRLAIGLCCAMALTVSAAEGKKDGKRPAMTDEQKAVMKEMVGKYDKNSDKKLDKDERAAMSAEDKAKMAKAFPPRKKDK